MHGWQSEARVADDYIIPPRRISEHEAARLWRMTNVRGHFINCRHYRKTGERSFICGKYGRRRSCEGCFTCPNCGGLMFTYNLSRSRTGRTDADGIKRVCITITHTKSCALCGAYIEENMIGFARQHGTKSENKCQVMGCPNTAYDGHTHEEDGQLHLICEHHRNKIKAWKQHPTKGEDQRPLIILGGKLVDNPEYVIKQTRRK